MREVLKSDKNVNAEKVNRIRVYSGEKFTAIDEAAAGTVCAVTGITFAKPGDGLGAQADSDCQCLSLFSLIVSTFWTEQTHTLPLQNLRL